MSLFNSHHQVDVHVHFDATATSQLASNILKVLDRLERMEKNMSKISDKIAAVGTSLDAAIARVQGDVVTLQDKIAELEALVASGTATPEELDALDALKAKLDAIDPVKDAVLPEE